MIGSIYICEHDSFQRRYVSAFFIKGVVDKNGSFIEKEAVLENKVELSDSIWETVNSGMVQFAQNNSVLRDMEFSVAGKTGTAQESKSRPDHEIS